MRLTATETPGRPVQSASRVRWKALVGHSSAALLSLLFLLSGLWKMLDLESAAERMLQTLVPVALSLPAAMVVSVGETFTAVLLLLPGFRRWGAWLASAMLVLFMAHIGLFYGRLLGEDCNCFPWIRRVVGPAFFAGDAGMLALAVLAGWRSRKPRNWRAAAGVLSGILVLALGSYAVASTSRARISAPATILVGGTPYRLDNGRLLLYFFDPECSHCLMVAREMSRQLWTGAEVIGVPTAQPQFARDFLRDAGLRAAVATDGERLRKTFRFTDPPYAVALVNGRQAAAFNSGQLEEESYYQTLRKLGFIK
jgi:uncharacterized membrane protein YphA (DoxX/SURF4 family)